MQLVLQDKNSRAIVKKDEVAFYGNRLFYLVSVTARVKSEKQLNDATDDEDLAVRIDGKGFGYGGETKANNFDAPPAFSGGQLHNLSKTVYFLTFLEGTNHKIEYTADFPPGTAVVERAEAAKWESEQVLRLELKLRAEDGDRRPWVTFVFDNLSLKKVTLTITYSHRKRDSDDVKIKIDGVVQRNNISLTRWMWSLLGGLLPFLAQSKTETLEFTVSLPRGFHWVELIADRMPTLEKASFDFGVIPDIPKRVPTVNDPDWTGDYNDDTETMLLARLLLGETEGQPELARAGVAYTVINRFKGSNTGTTLKEVMLKPNQYDGLWNVHTIDKVRYPSNRDSPEEWRLSYEVAEKVLAGTVADPTNGATNFHSYSVGDPDWPRWATPDKYKAKFGNIYFYEL